MDKDLLKIINELKSEILDLKKENEELNNRFGLFWKEVPEKMIKNISDNEIVYGKSLYSFITKIKNGEGKSINANINGKEIKLSRQADSYLFKDSNNNEYLVFSDSLYKFSKETQEEYIPILKEKGGDFYVGDNKDNILIEGDNYYALQMLQYTHKGKIDAICIDPPYNTGNKDFKYNDKFIKDGDTDKHSYWLSFMKKRIKLAKNLLKEDGLIFLNIDEYEFAQLKLLLDSVFGEDNFITNITWYKNNSKGNVKTIANTTEYILVYSKNKSKIKKMIVKKESALKMLHKAEEIKKQGLSLENSNKEFKKYLKTISEELTGGEKKYNRIDNNGDIYTDKPLTAPGSQLFYDIKHPITGLACKLPSRGWAFKEDKIQELIDSDKIGFGKDHTTVPFLKYKLKDYTMEVMKNHFEITANSENTLKELFISNFPYPKPLKLIKQLIATKDKESLILDFFAGSGTTGHAVWDLNKEDGGNRKFILCTNNENNICEDVTFERLKRSNEKYGYNESLKYLTIKHVKKDSIVNKIEYENKIKDLLK